MSEITAKYMLDILVKVFKLDISEYADTQTLFDDIVETAVKNYDIVEDLEKNGHEITKAFSDAEMYAKLNEQLVAKEKETAQKLMQLELKCNILTTKLKNIETQYNAQSQKQMHIETQMAKMKNYLFDDAVYEATFKKCIHENNPEDLNTVVEIFAKYLKDKKIRLRVENFTDYRIKNWYDLYSALVELSMSTIIRHIATSSKTFNFK